MKKLLIKKNILIIMIGLCVVLYVYFGLFNGSPLYNVVSKVDVLETRDTREYSYDERFGKEYLRARDIKRQRDIDKLSSAISLYYLENQEYPDSLLDLKPDYLHEIPVDPQSLEIYSEYQLINDGNDFEICVNLEDSQSLNYPRYCFTQSTSD